ncbi:helix-turn-helix domain-containing protein [Hymenobacter sp. HD11105]
MPLRATLFDLLVLVGIVQGVVTLFLLGLNKARSPHKSVLLLLLLVMVGLSFKILVHTLGLWDHPPFQFLPLAVDTTVQPLVYLYVCALTTRNFSFRRHHALHFVPTLLFLGHALVVYAVVVAQPDVAIKNGLAESLYYNRVKVIEDGVAVVSGLGYWWLSFKEVQQYQAWLYHNQSSTQRQELTWLRNILAVTGVLVAALGVKTLLENVGAYERYFPGHWQLFHIYLAVITYYIAFKGYRVYEATENTPEPRAIVAAGGGLPPPTPAIFLAAGTDARPPEAAASALGPGPLDLAEIKTEILAALEIDRLFLQPELSLKDLAAHIGRPAATVSTTINQCFQQNFRTLINQYRVDEVQRRMAGPEARHLSLLGLALECGFNSEASFYRIFRQLTGTSPKDFMNARPG